MKLSCIPDTNSVMPKKLSKPLIKYCVLKKKHIHIDIKYILACFSAGCTKDKRHDIFIDVSEVDVIVIFDAIAVHREILSCFQTGSFCLFIKRWHHQTFSIKSPGIVSIFFVISMTLFKWRLCCFQWLLSNTSRWYLFSYFRNSDDSEMSLTLALIEF